MEQAERFRQKLRDRNLGRVAVQTYPANQKPGSLSSQDRFAQKLAKHGHAAEAPVEASAPAPEKSKAKYSGKG